MKRGGKASRDKGLRFERWVVNEFKAMHIRAKRAWGSDGRSMGLSESVDVVAMPFKEEEIRIYYQLKHLKKLPVLCHIPDGVTSMILKETGKDPVVVMKLDQYMSWLFLLGQGLDRMSEAFSPRQDSTAGRVASFSVASSVPDRASSKGSRS